MFSFAFDAICTQQSTFRDTMGRLGTQKSTENTTECIGTQQSTFRDTTGRMGTQQSTFRDIIGHQGTQQVLLGTQPGAYVLDSIGRGSSHNIEVGPWFSKSVPCTQHSWTKKSSIKVQEDARDDIDCIH
jgi:hypothetical protein